MLRKIKIITFLFFSFLPFAFASESTSTAMNQLLDNYSTLNIGALVVEASSGKVLYEKNSNRYFMPASNEKLFTAYSAFLYLPMTFRYYTYLFADLSRIENGNLNDDVYFKFTGDPTFSYEELDILVSALEKANIKAISGDIIIDDSAFDDEVMSPGTTWDDMQFCFGSPISAIIINHNCIASQSKSDAEIKIAIPNPRENLKQTLYALLAKHHIIFYKKILFNTINRPVKYLTSVASPALPDLIKTMLKESDNTIANSLFKTIGSLTAKQPGSWKNGQQAMQNLLRSSLQIDFSNRSFFDGAGGSRYNLITPRQLVFLLQKVKTMPFADAFINALPIAGVDGTLQQRLQNPLLKGKIYAKTGSMSDASTLSGYLLTSDNRLLIFALMINGFAESPAEIKQFEDRICEMMTHL